MPTYAAKIIMKPRKVRRCDNIRCQRVIKTNERQVRLFGRAMRGDSVTTAYLCLDCARESEDSKIQIAIVNFEYPLNETCGEIIQREI